MKKYRVYKELYDNEGNIVQNGSTKVLRRKRLTNYLKKWGGNYRADIV